MEQWLTMEQWLVCDDGYPESGHHQCRNRPHLFAQPTFVPNAMGLRAGKPDSAPLYHTSCFNRRSRSIVFISSMLSRKQTMMFKFDYLLMTPALAAAALFMGCETRLETNETPVPEQNTQNVSHMTAQDGHAHAEEMATVDQAVCVLMPVGDSGVRGTLKFMQTDDGIKVSGEVTGLTPGKHGFHVHEFGDITDMETGKSTGGHFNPEHKMHGKREADERHAGDFGNIEANQDGTATIEFTDKLITMSGKMSIVGRGIVIHADEDKFTQPTGDAGGRVAIGVIGVAKSME